MIQSIEMHIMAAFTVTVWDWQHLLTGERLERFYLFRRLKHLLDYISVYEWTAEVTTAFRTLECLKILRWMQIIYPPPSLWSVSALNPSWLYRQLNVPCCYRSFSAALNAVVKHSSEILFHIDMIASRSCCRFVGCTSMMWISRSTSSQRCSIGLRSGDCGGHLSKVNSLSCSRNQSEIIWALWHDALSCWK